MTALSKKISADQKSGMKYLQSMVRSAVGAINSDVLFLFLFLAAIRAPYLSPDIWPDHDTGCVFQTFYSFYNEFFFRGGLLRWIPYGTAGIAGDYFQLTQLSPTSYAAGLVGSIFRIKDALVLFKWSVIAEELALLLGTYHLSRALFKHRSAVLFVSLGVAASSLWLGKLYWNLRIYYLLPLILYFLLQFFREKKWSYFFLAAVTLTLAQLGTILYGPPFQLLLLLPYVVALAVEYNIIGERKKLLTVRPKEYMLAAVFLITASVVVYFMRHSLDGIRTYIYDRDARTGTVSLETFLSFGGAVGAKKFLALIFAGGSETVHPHHPLFDVYGAGEHTLYIGLLPLLFILYSLRAVRKPFYAVTLFLSIYLVLLSLGGQTPVAPLTYRFLPFMRFFRYIGHVGGVLRLFLLLAAGFGFDQFLTDTASAKSQKNKSKLLLFSCASIFSLIVFFVYRFASEHIPTLIPWPNLFFGTAVSVLLFIIILLFFKLNTAWAGTLAVLLYAAGMFGYQFAYLRDWPRRAWPYPQVSDVRDYAYQEERSDTFSRHPRTQSARQVVESSIDKHALTGYQFIQHDPCGSPYWISMRAEPVDRLFSLRGSDQIPENKTHFWKAVGCHSPKLRLFTDVLFAEDAHEAERQVRETSRIGERIILEHVPEETQKAWEAVPHPAAEGNLRVATFSANEVTLDAEIKNPDGAWLYYADAYHPDWQVRVNGEKAPLAEANLAFKAVRLDQGHARVTFLFSNPLKKTLGYLLACTGVLFSAVLFWYSLKILFTRRVKNDPA